MVILILIIGLIPLSTHAENITEELNITWENSGEITFVVPSNQWFQFGIGINSTSVNSQDLVIEIIGESNWGINESYFDIKGENLTNNQSFQLNANESTNITAKIFVPEIENGMPLAETDYPFKLKLSNSTGALAFWNYAISILPTYSIIVDEIIENSNIDPSGTTTHEIKIRNTGNILTEFNSEISPLDSNGNVIITNESNRFVIEGWNATLSGWIGALSLEPNESNIFKITVNAPYSSIGGLSLLLHLESSIGGVSENIYLNTSILTIKDSEIILSETNCEVFVLGEKCNLNLKITNIGNYNEIVQNSNCTSNSNFILFSNIGSIIDEVPTNKIQLSTYDQTNILLGPNEFINIEFEIIFGTTDTYVEAGTIASITCNYYSTDLTEIDTSELNISVGEFYEVTQDLIPETWIEEKQLFLSINLQNEGNSPESFAVSISVSHEGNHGLLLPENAIYDLNSTRIRGYDILELEPNEMLNITGWMSIPNSNIEDENIWISINAYTYSNSFENTWATNMTITGIGSENNSIEEDKKGFNYDAIRNLFNAYGYSALALIIASIMIFQALKIRSQRNNSENKGVVSKEKDWMSTFFLRKNKEIHIESPSMNKNEFKQMFSEKTGNKKIEDAPMPNKNILKDASDTIDKIKNQPINELLDDLKIDEEYDY